MLVRGFNRLDLNPEVLWSIRDQNVRFVPVIRDRQKDLPSVLHEPTDGHTFVGGVLEELMGPNFSFRLPSWHALIVMVVVHIIYG